MALENQLVRPLARRFADAGAKRVAERRAASIATLGFSPDVLQAAHLASNVKVAGKRVDPLVVLGLGALMKMFGF